ncbi:MAG: hypothetical protein IT371_02730 [Deltaproteobacteria bacterium]|nr:hypothetical protein [Deltaproteobacteria bacterium]
MSESNRMPVNGNSDAVPRSRAAAAPLLLALTCAAACAEEQVVTTTRNLNRPGALAFACAARVGDAGVTTALTSSECVAPAGGTPRGSLYGFVANVARGDVAVFRAGGTGEPLVDLEPQSPGYGFVPVGDLPTELKSTADGCRVVSANSGSCDLAVIDVPAVLQQAAGERRAPASSLVSRITPRTRRGPLRARPQSLAIVPGSVPAKGDAQCPVVAPYRAYVTFPRCQLLAEIDLRTGELVRGLVFGKDGYTETLDPVCPAECALRGETGRPDAAADGPAPRDATAADAAKRDAAGAEARVPDARAVDATPRDGASGDGLRDAAPKDAAAGDRDAARLEGGARDLSALDARRDAGVSASDRGAGSDRGAPSDGGAVALPQTSPGGVLPFTLALVETGERLFVSSAGANFVTAVDVNPGSGAFERPRRILLSGAGAESGLLALSPPTRALGRFLYVATRDRSVRVVSTDLERECETNLDLAKVQDGGVPLPRARCFVAGAAETPPRRVTATGPGLRFGSRIPQALSFLQVPRRPLDGGVDGGPYKAPLRGVFALVATSDGNVYVVDIEDENFVPGPSAAVAASRLPHRVRNELQGRVEGVPDAGVVAISGASGKPVPVIVSETNGQSLPGQGIYLRGVGEPMSSDWSLVYEDRLVDRVSGQLRLNGPELALADPGGALCQAGVEGRELEGGRIVRHGDIVTLVGCKADEDCGLGQLCRKPVAQQAEFGLCFDASRADDLFRQCSPFLQGKREYRVVRASQTQLALDLLPVEPQVVVRQRPQLDGGCKENRDCQDGHYCALADRSVPGRPELSIRRGECFRPGCDSDKDCGGVGQCLSPLDGSAKVCASSPPPLEVGGACKRDEDCSATKQLPATCETDRDCGSPYAECRLPSPSATQKSCRDRGLVCSRLPGRRDVCVRTSPCFTQVVRYEVRAGRSFLVGGYRRSIADSLTGECRADASRSVLYADRIPLGLPTYPVIAGPRCEQSVTPLADPAPNPCFERVATGYGGFVEKEGTTGRLLNPPEPGPATVVRYANPDLWLSLGLGHLATRSTVVSRVDAGVGAPAVEAHPMPERGLTIRVQVGSGYARMVAAGASSTLSLPAAILPGPDGQVYVVDMGDRPGSSGTRGQVVRFDQLTMELNSSFVVR